jgi:hypothetical protein
MRYCLARSQLSLGVRPQEHHSMQSPQVKIALSGPDGEVETLWADPTPDGFYALDNVPWYAVNVSLGDLVEATPDANGFLEMSRVVRKSGNRTLRVILDLTDPDREWTLESRALVAAIRDRGCDIENMNNKLIAVTVPPGVDLITLGNHIDERGFQFEYADPTFEDLFPEDAPTVNLSPEA